MSRIQLPLLIGSIFLTFLQSSSQDKIYLQNSTKQGKISAINEGFISYLPSGEKIKTTNVPTRSVVLLFNTKGGYLIPSKMDWSEDKSKSAIISFLKQDSSYWMNDRIFETDKNVEEGRILNVDEKEFEISTKNATKKIPRSLVVFTIYKDGKHAIQGSIELTADILTGQFGPYNGIYPFKNSELAPKIAGDEKIATGDSAGRVINADGTLTINSFLTEELKKQMEIKTLDKTKRFGQYLELLCDRTKPLNELNTAIDLAVDLFVNEDAIVETSSLTSDHLDNKTIRLYLNSLKHLKYDRINLEWTNVQYADHLILSADGTYRGTVTFQQKFSGFIDNELKYEDITKKQTEIIVKSYKKIVNGEEQVKWDIVLGDVGVKSTNRATNP